MIINAKSNDKTKKHKTSIGGQAVIEGVMMRGVEQRAIVVRLPDGTTETCIKQNTSIKDKLKFLKLPVLRGAVNFIEMMGVGYQDLMYSAEKAGLEDDVAGKNKDAEAIENIEAHEDTDKAEKEDKPISKGVFNVMMVVSMVIGLGLALGLFVFLPAFTTKILFVGLDSFLLTKFTDNSFLNTLIGSDLLKTIIEGVVRIGLLVLYFFIVSRMKDIKRVFEYHGAEHKTIFAYEADDELTVENVKKYPRLHPRCGTSFLVIAAVVSIILYTIVPLPWENVWLRMVFKLLLMPVIVGFSYEIIRIAGKYDTNIFSRIISAPGKLFQKMTTREPDDKQLEVAIESLKAVLTSNRNDDEWK